MKNVVYLIHTEYHLLQSLYSLNKLNYLNNNTIQIHFIIKSSSTSKRLKQNLNLDFLPIKVHYLQVDKNYNEKIKKDQKKKIDELIYLKPVNFYFFQEQDPIMLLLIYFYKKSNSKITLVQDGLKPYVANSMKFSPSLHINDFKQNLWIRKNGYPVHDWLSFLKCNKYGFVKGIDQLFLSFPDMFKNPKKIPALKLDPGFEISFIKMLEKVFGWQNSFLPKTENIIFFMNQPMHDDGSFEINLLNKLRNKYTQAPIYIKNHPNTPESKTRLYNQLSNVNVIDSKIPAELFISKLKNSIILSLCSTSMFIDNPSSKFYYLFNIQEKNNIERLKHYKVINPTNHVETPLYIDDIVF